MNFDERTRLDNERTYGSDDRTELDNNYSTNYEDIVKPDEYVGPDSKGGNRWKTVAIGGTAGILMGAAGAFAGNAALNGVGTLSSPSSSEEEDIITIADDEDDPSSVINVQAENVVINNDVEPEVIAEPVPEPVVEPVVEPVYVSPEVNDDMSFNDAFAAAREELGPGGLFVWHGNVYNTYYAEEWNAMSSESQEAFADSASNVNIPVYHNVNTTEDYIAYAPDTAQDDIMVVSEPDDDVHIIGVYEENIDGQNMYIGEVEMAGENVVLVDGDQDGLFDVLIADMDGDGMIADNEFVDISSDGILVSDLAGESMASYDDPVAYRDTVDYDSAGHSDMPDYMNDADVSMC